MLRTLHNPNLMSPVRRPVACTDLILLLQHLLNLLHTLHIQHEVLRPLTHTQRPLDLFDIAGEG